MGSSQVKSNYVGNFPTVSVIMPMYNSEKYVRQAIESLLKQTYADFEIIAINDGSKDGCADVVRNIHDERVVFIDRENRGFLNTLNECIDIAKGKYIARLDDDDWCYPTRLEKQVKYLDEHPETVLVGALDDEQTGDNIVRIPETTVKTSKQIRYSLVFGNYAFAHSSFMMRRDVLVNNDIRYEMFKQVPDYHMITQLSRFGEIARIPENLVVYRIHPAQSTQVRSAQMKQGEIDHAREWFIDSLTVSEEHKCALKKGILRELRTYEDIKGFNLALEEYGNQCKINRTEDGECMMFVYRKCMLSQLCTPELLIASVKSGDIGWMLSIDGIKFIIKCLIRRNPYYLKTEVKI